MRCIHKCSALTRMENVGIWMWDDQIQVVWLWFSHPRKPIYIGHQYID
ncbi:hypothetical protein Goari_018222 [Gossypium aridum]|uniref:Uncharacterized protein n=1 Tax=Gossypium aridum TaxID=34290 RepID=A0A7J8WP98_GOSAI|nr:hypothetical protein [Gossypium aridum]MBA0676764.1 hypothetical protein [Gossypium aridum]